MAWLECRNGEGRILLWKQRHWKVKAVWSGMGAGVEMGLWEIAAVLVVLWCGGVERLRDKVRLGELYHWEIVALLVVMWCGGCAGMEKVRGKLRFCELCHWEIVTVLVAMCYSGCAGMEKVMGKLRFCELCHWEIVTVLVAMCYGGCAGVEKVRGKVPFRAPWHWKPDEWKHTTEIMDGTELWRSKCAYPYRNYIPRYTQPVIDDTPEDQLFRIRDIPQEEAALLCSRKNRRRITLRPPFSFQKSNEDWRTVINGTKEMFIDRESGKMVASNKLVKGGEKWRVYHKQRMQRSTLRPVPLMVVMAEDHSHLLESHQFRNPEKIFDDRRLIHPETLRRYKMRQSEQVTQQD